MPDPIISPVIRGNRPLIIRPPSGGQLPLPAPLNVSGAIAGIQGARSLNLREREFDLREKQFIQDNQNAIYDFINNSFKETFGDTLNQRDANGLSSFGLDPSIYGKEISQLNELRDRAEEDMFGLVKNINFNDPAQLNEAKIELVRRSNQLQRDIRNSPRLAEVMRNQKLFDSMQDSMFNLLSKNEKATINPKRYNEVLEKLQRNAARRTPLSLADFNPNRVVFDRDDARTKLDTGVKAALGDTEYKQLLNQSGLPSGLSATATVTLQRERNKARQIAMERLAGDHDVMGMADSLATVTGISSEEALGRLIDNAIDTFEKDPNVIGDLKVQNLPRGSTTKASNRFPGDSLAATKANTEAKDIEAKGFDSERDVLEGGSADARILDIAQLKEDGANIVSTIETVPSSPGDTENPIRALVYTDRDDGKIIAAFPEKEVPEAATETPVEETTTETPETPANEETGEVGTSPAFENLERRESSGGKNLVNPNDGGAASVGHHQFNGELGQEFLEELGITEFDVTKPLNKEQEKALEERLSGIDNLLELSRNFLLRNHVPTTEGIINSVGFPLSSVDSLPEALKLPVLSMSANHSPAGQRRILELAKEKLPDVDPTDAEIITAIQEARKEYVESLGFDENLEDALLDRYEDELEEALGLLQVSPQTSGSKFYQFKRKKEENQR